MIKKTFRAVLLLLILCPLLVWANTKMRQLQIVSSTIDSTPIGFTTPSTGAFTSVTLGSGQVLSSTTGGTSGIVQTTHTISGATTGTTICYNSSGEIIFGTTCGATAVQSAHAAGCTTSGSSYATCTVSMLWLITFADTSYNVSCTGYSPSGFPYIAGVSAKSTTGVTVTIANGTSNGSVASSYTDVECVAIHP